MVPFAPGGGTDVAGRIFAAALQQRLQRPLIVENRGGSASTHGTAVVAKAPRDGCTLLVQNVSFAINATLLPGLPYDPLRDLTAVAIVAEQPSVVAVAPGVRARTLREFVALAASEPMRLVYVSGGVGSSGHLAAERLMMATGMRMLHVPYKGLAQALADLSEGRGDVAVATVSTALPLLRDAKLRALAVTTEARSALFPELPTVKEAGVPGYVVSTWYAMLVPGGTATSLVARLDAALADAAGDRRVQGALKALGLTAKHVAAGQAQEFVASEIARWSAVTKKVRAERR